MSQVAAVELGLNMVQDGLFLLLFLALLQSGIIMTLLLWIHWQVLAGHMMMVRP